MSLLVIASLMLAWTSLGAWCAVRLLHDDFRSLHLPLYFSLGTVLWAYAAFLWNRLGLLLGPRGIEFGLGVCFVLGLLIRPKANFRKSNLSWMEKLFLGLLLLAIFVALAQALALPMTMWDSIVIYGYKAKILFYEGTFQTPAFLDPQRLHLNADYPLLVSYLEASFYHVLGHTDDRVVKLLFWIYWLSFLGVIFAALIESARRSLALAVTTMVATLPLFSNDFMGQATAGFVDIPFALYWTGTLLALLRWRLTVSKADLWTAALLALGCAFTKNEGLALLPIINFVFLFLVPRARRRSLLLGSFCLLLVLSPWLWTRAHLPHNADHYLGMPENFSLRLIPRLLFVLKMAWVEVSALSEWGVFWGLLVLACLSVRGRPMSRESLLLMGLVFLQAGVYLGSYLLYDFNVRVLLPVTLLRVMIHLIGPLAIAAGLV